MGCKYVKDFKFDSANGYTGSTGKTEVKAYMRGGVVRKAPLDAKVPKQAPTDMRPLRTANAKTAMKEATQKRVSGASGKISTAGQYAKGGAVKKSGKYADGGYVNQSGVAPPLTPEEMAQANSAPTGPQRAAAPGTQLTPVNQQQGGPLSRMFQNNQLMSGQLGFQPNQASQQQMQKPSPSMNRPGDIRISIPAMPTSPQRGGMPQMPDERAMQRMQNAARRSPQRPQQQMNPAQMQNIQKYQQQIQNSPQMRQLQNLSAAIQKSGGVPSALQQRQLAQMQMALQKAPGMQQLRQAQGRTGEYAKGGMACATGCQVEMKKGGKSKKADKKADKKAPAKKPAARRSDKQSDAMAEQVLMQMLAQASQTGTMPGMPMQDMPMQNMPMQGMPMPAPGARAFPTSSQAPMLPMKSGGMSRGQQAKVGRVMGEYKRGDLHSGSKSGPVVKNRDQAVAIAMSEARKKRA